MLSSLNTDHSNCVFVVLILNSLQVNNGGLGSYIHISLQHLLRHYTYFLGSSLVSDCSKYNFILPNKHT